MSSSATSFVLMATSLLCRALGEGLISPCGHSSCSALSFVQTAQELRSSDLKPHDANVLKRSKAERRERRESRLKQAERDAIGEETIKQTMQAWQDERQANHLDCTGVEPDAGADAKESVPSAENFVELVAAVPLVHGPKGEEGWRNRLLVWPEKKFAFCAIEKVACTQFNVMLNHLNGIHEYCRPQERWWRSTHSNFVTNFSDITKENGWRKAIFVRDPLERFLSGWSSKCQAWENGGRHCLGGRSVRNDNSEEAVAKFEAIVRNNLTDYIRKRRKAGHYNAHYDPQHTFCGGGDYDFVGYLSSDTADVHKQVQTMFASVAGVPADDSTFWKYLNDNFPAEQVEGHHTGSGSRLRTFYRSPDVYNAVVQAYKDDYSKFSLDVQSFKDWQRV